MSEFNPMTATFFLKDKDGKVLLKTKKANSASDFSCNNRDKIVEYYAQDANGNTRDLSSLLNKIDKVRVSPTSKMTFDEFQKIEDLINSKIQALETEREQARQKFIDDNKPFEVGDKVKVFVSGKERGVAIVTGFNDDSFGMVKPNLKKIKNDGTASSQTFYAGFGATFEKI